MNIDDFKEIILKDNPSNYKWRENMLLATKLYKSRGFKVKDVKEDSLIDDVFIYLTNLFKDIQSPSVNDFIKYKFIEDKFSSPDDLRKVVNEDFLRDLYPGLDPGGRIPQAPADMGPVREAACAAPLKGHGDPGVLTRSDKGPVQTDDALLHNQIGGDLPDQSVIDFPVVGHAGTSQSRMSILIAISFSPSG